MTDPLGATQGQTCANYQLHDLHGMNQSKPSSCGESGALIMIRVRFSPAMNNPLSTSKSDKVSTLLHDHRVLKRKSGCQQQEKIIVVDAHVVDNNPSAGQQATTCSC